jgi:hypothetical protein
MIDWSRPVRRTDNKNPVTVIKVNEDGTAWVELLSGYAYLMDREGKKRGTVPVENTPEPRLAYLRAYQDGHVSAIIKPYAFEGWGSGKIASCGNVDDYLLDLTDPNNPKIERVTK